MDPWAQRLTPLRLCCSQRGFGRASPALRGNLHAVRKLETGSDGGGRARCPTPACLSRSRAGRRTVPSGRAGWCRSAQATATSTRRPASPGGSAACSGGTDGSTRPPRTAVSGARTRRSERGRTSPRPGPCSRRARSRRGPPAPSTSAPERPRTAPAAGAGPVAGGARRVGAVGRASHPLPLGRLRPPEPRVRRRPTCRASGRERRWRLPLRERRAPVADQPRHRRHGARLPPGRACHAAAPPAVPGEPRHRGGRVGVPGGRAPGARWGSA